jgi:hypothetical protein
VLIGSTVKIIGDPGIQCARLVCHDVHIVLFHLLAQPPALSS